MVKDFIKNSVLKPALARLGTVAAAYLVMGGDWACKVWDTCGLVTEGGAQMVVTYVAAAICLAYDVIFEWAQRKVKR